MFSQIFRGSPNLPVPSQEASLGVDVVNNILYIANPISGTWQQVSSGGGGTSILLSAQGAGTALTGNSSAQTFYSYTLPASTLSSGQGLRVVVGWNHSSGTANVTYNFTLNGQNLNSGGLISSGTGGFKARMEMVVTAGNAASVATDYTPGVAVVDVASVTGLNFGANQTLLATFNVANTDQVTPIMFTVEAL